MPTDGANRRLCAPHRKRCASAVCAWQQVVNRMASAWDAEAAVRAAPAGLLRPRKSVPAGCPGFAMRSNGLAAAFDHLEKFRPDAEACLIIWSIPPAESGVASRIASICRVRIV
jgi:hypothetical protein